MRVIGCALMLATAVVIIGPHLAEATTDKIFCFFQSWANYRPGNGKFIVEDIDPLKCTHYVYALFGIHESGEVKILDSWNEIDLKGLKRFGDLKTKNPSVKLLVSIGGWNEGSSKYSGVANNPSLRSTFAESVVNFLNQYNFDGLVLDWEYPGARDGASSDKVAYVTLLRDLRTGFDSSGKNYYLGAAVGVTDAMINTSYDIPQMKLYLDFIFLMSYDFHGAWNGVTGQNAPLYASSVESSALSSLNVDYAVRRWIAQGAPQQSLILGIPAYGRTFTLSNPSNTGLGAATSGPGYPGPYTREGGILSYMEICEKINAGGWTVVFDEEQQVPHALKGNQWIGYDNVQSVTLKAQYAITKGLGGVGLYSLDQDDFRNICGEGKSSLLNAVRNTLVASAT